MWNTSPESYRVLMSDHPRFRHYPHHADYKLQGTAFRPFVMSVQEPGYRTASVNTDRLGLREQYDADGEYLDFDHLQERYVAANVLIGGSTAFGVDATSDRATIPAHLHQPGLPCLNLGVRGATCRQELALYLVLKPRLPALRNVILLSGVNEVSLACLEDTVFYPPFGSTFWEPQHFSQCYEQYRQFAANPSLIAIDRLHMLLDRCYFRSAWGRAPLRLLAQWFWPKPRAEKPALRFDEKLDLALGYLENDLETWGALQTGLGFRAHYVLQPIAGWTLKPLSAVERELLDADRALIPSIGQYTGGEVHARCVERIRAACERGGIAFHDANPWLDDAAYAGRDLFSDVCHLSDEGNRVVAALLRENLDWKA
jgi:hypothetical protein